MIPAGDIFAIHAIIEDRMPLPRKQGPVSLEMPIEIFHASTQAQEIAPAIGQFEDEQRFELTPPPTTTGVENLIVDFFQGTLFRIEVNYQPVESKPAALEDLIDVWSQRYGQPRVNSFPGARLFFWDDGATRMILQIDAMAAPSVYSVTYIDDDLFHRISRERVQRETEGRSSYGK